MLLTVNFYCNKQKIIYQIGFEILACLFSFCKKISGSFDSLINVYDIFEEEVSSGEKDINPMQRVRKFCRTVDQPFGNGEGMFYQKPYIFL